MHVPELYAQPPYEAKTLFIEITRGCPQERPCRYCAVYDPNYASIDREVYEAELDEIARVYMYVPERVWLLSHNPFALEQDKILYYLETLSEKLPGVKSVGAYVRVADLKQIDDDALARMAELGVNDISLGVESGDDETLRIAGKEHTAADVVEQCARLDKVGIKYMAYYMPGLAGAGNGQRNAEATAKVFNQIHPSRIYAISTAIYDHTPFREDEINGTYTRACEWEILEELVTFVDNLTCETTFDCTNEANNMLFKVESPVGCANAVDQMRTLLEGLDREKVENFHRVPTIWKGRPYNFQEHGFTRSGMI